MPLWSGKGRALALQADREKGKKGIPMLEHIIELCLPTIISACELMGIFVVAVTALHAFWLYCAGMVTRKPRNIKFQLAEGLATSLEFKMAPLFLPGQSHFPWLP